MTDDAPRPRSGPCLVLLDAAGMVPAYLLDGGDGRSPCRHTPAPVPCAWAAEPTARGPAVRCPNSVTGPAAGSVRLPSGAWVRVRRADVVYED